MSMISVGIIGFIVMVGLMLVGLPIGAVMLLVGLAGGMMAFGMAFLNSAASVAWGTMSENGLTAIPLFALLAATSGSSVATAATIGTVALPSLKRYGYPMPDALGSLAAGGTLGIMIPPSINFIIYGSMTDTSAGKLFIAGIIPGLMLAGLFMVYIFITALIRKEKVKPIDVPREERIRLLRYLIEPVAVFGTVMGSLYLGIATATESAALGLMVAFLLVIVQGKLSWPVLQTCFLSSARTSGMILLIVVGAFVLNLALSLTGIR